uniref:Secreted frizzled-related protein 2 n=1 Tax=Mesocestoides corti TaxID=53468 RepID=A0A5K3ELH7_MESCO
MPLLLTLLMVATAQANTPGRWDWHRSGVRNKAAVTSSPFGGSSLGRLTTADADMISNEPPQSPYFSDWNRLVSGYGSQRCYKIPREMKLCNNIGYDLMVLPNSLEHETMDEVITQSEVWMTLVKLGCHDELERFLCSLYAPVCIRGYHEKLIQPCRELCESVRAACLPTMTTFGLGWPDIVKCSKFPQSPQELCIPPNKPKNKTIVLKPETRCSGCVDKPTYESAIGSFCIADVVIRAKVLDVKPASSPGSRNTTFRIRTNGRMGVFKLPKAVSSPANLDFQMTCDCPIVRAAVTRPKGPGRWLLMGKLHDNRRTLLIQHISQPSWQNTEIKRAIRDIIRRPESLCKVDLMQPSAIHQSVAIYGSPSKTMQYSRPRHRYPGKNDSNQSPEKRKRRRHLRRRQTQRRNHSKASPLDTKHPSVGPSNALHQSMNSIHVTTSTPHPYHRQQKGHSPHMQ